MTDNINPTHYMVEVRVTLPNGPFPTARVECADVMEALGFNNNAYLWNAFSYIWRHKAKNGMEDIRKAIWYLQRMLPEEEEISPAKQHAAIRDGFGKLREMEDGE